MARTRNWAFIAYPDSAPENWKEILKAYHIKTAISPLHDKDLNPTGDEKKPHWHVYLEFDSVKSYEQVYEITQQLNATIPQAVQSPVGMIRYFIHKDNPEKHQYDFRDIEIYNGFDISKFDTYTEAELDSIFAEITLFIDTVPIHEYSDLYAYVRDPKNGHYEDWYRIVRKNTIFFTSYISSRRNQYKEWKKSQMQNSSKL